MRRNIRSRLMGNNLGGSSIQQLHQLEKQLTDDLVLNKEKKVLIYL
ncbi:hypothetical protein HanIR_Chr01g0011331 [Helianthus annuus]|nr:hypothetical protein HanIR_Chr01g0011331 [Helianthus annuus]